MSEEQLPKDTQDDIALSRQIEAQAKRKLKAQRHPQGVWFGLGMMGLIGWSVAIPTLLGIALGFWLDRQLPSKHSWTLALLIVGLVIGCLTAWHWVVDEHKAMEDDRDESDE